MSEFAEQAERLLSWMREDCLPMWARRARDHRGGFYEALSPDGAPLMDREKRFRVQPRQAYAFAHAEHLGLTEVGRSASDHAFAFTLEAGTDDHSLGGEAPFTGFVHRLTPTGEVADPLRDTYDHAFVLLACAWRIIAFGDEQARRVAERTLRFLDTIRQPDGSYLEGSPASLPRRQNPHMHLLEAFMALHRAGVDGALDRARQVRSLFAERFWDGHVLREFFAEDWTPDADRGEHVEPGHMVEWVWLLGEYEALTGEDQSGVMRTLFDAAMRTGLRDGWLIDEATADGTPVRTTRRSWAQIEHAKAAMTLARRGADGMEARAADVLSRLMDSYFAAPIAGGWNEQYGEDGRVVSEDMPTSILYHVVSLAAEADRTLKSAPLAG